MVDQELKIHELFHLEETIVSADEERDERCMVCGKPLISGVTAYRSRDCPALFHDKCTKLPTPIMNHALHPNHTFHLVLQQPPYITLHCMFCFNRISGKFAYRCAVADCHLILDINCATLPKFTVASDFPAPEQVQHCSHAHPLVFIDEDVDEALKRRCNACWKSVAGGPFHGCLRCGFWLHRKCFDLPQKISHPSHRKHPLMLIAASSARPYPQGLRICDMCNYPIYEPLLFYHCRFCSFDVHVACISLPRIFKSLAHPDHSLHLLRRKCEFVCDWTGDKIEGAPYICTESNLVLRKQFVETPYSLTITHHHHKVVHTFSTMTELEPDHKVECHICGDELNQRYGHYSCPDQSCDYVAHLMCAWHRSVNKLQVMHDNVLNLEHSSLPADPPSSPSSSPSSSSTPSSSKLQASLLDESTHGKVEHLAKILPFEIVGEGLTRSTVLLMQHVLHRHLLCCVQRITPDADDDDDIRCFACWLQITDVSSTMFRCIGPCQFFLHETCAFMPPKLKHWIHPHTLTLGYKHTIICRACKYESGGLYYICDPCGFTICLCCTKISDVLEHPGHIHKLFFDTRIDQIHTCNACGNPCGASIIATNPFAFTCGKCEFYVDHSCLILPEITRHAYHDHVLTLSFKDDESNLSNIVCNICEEDRDPHHWFYVCKDCESTPSDFKAHPKCVLGKHPFIPVGMHTFFSPAVHEHGLKTNKVSYYPECGQCKQVIEDDIAAVCEESDCSFTAHWECTCNSKQKSLH